MFRDANGRPGHALVELLVAALIVCVIAVAASATFIAQSRLARRASDRSETQAAIRSGMAVLSYELRALEPGQDVPGLGRDSARIRAFRGRGIVCARDSTSAHVRYSGLRSPDPAKDSMLVLTAAGREVTAAVTAVNRAQTAPCAGQPGETVLAFAPDTLLVPGAIALIFEHGEYHLSNAALRYRRGGAGRQPLTPSVLADDSTELALQLRAGAILPDTVAVQVRLGIMALPPSNAVGVLASRVPLLNITLPLDSLEAP
jgi:type II secretory pathway component PulJ